MHIIQKTQNSLEKDSGCVGRGTFSFQLSINKHFFSKEKVKEFFYFPGGQLTSLSKRQSEIVPWHARYTHWNACDQLTEIFLELHSDTQHYLYLGTFIFGHITAAKS
uniref:Uncharacterized protein n=1 Tax=Micrurus lemniscatus lemniscatus TaxID=129467 RepID=A0A2D4IGW4_MICLE